MTRKKDSETITVREAYGLASSLTLYAEIHNVQHCAFAARVLRGLLLDYDSSDIIEIPVDNRDAC